MIPDSMQEGLRLLVVEDDPNLRMLLNDYLELMQFQVDTASDGEQGLEKTKRGDYDLYILDVMLPRMDGFTLASHIREKDASTPIIFLTAKTMQEDRLTGFLRGGDDYVTKPFNTDELYARIKAILKRSSRNKHASLSDENFFKLGKITFDYNNLLLSSPLGNRHLTRKEAAVLKLLCENRNNLVLRETAQKVVWGETDYLVSRSMDVFIARLRKYLRADPAVTITNVHGMGFMLKIDGGNP